MIGGVVDIAGDGRHLSVYRGFLKVSADGGEIGRVPLDDITALLLTARQVTLSRSVMTELMARKAVIVTCGDNYHPAGLTWPLAAHHAAAGVLQDQIGAGLPLKKRLWRQIVVAKIAAQAAVLAHCAPGHAALPSFRVLIKQVRSGDPDNREAQAARLYWPALMGADFRRDRAGGPVNAALNYGYAIVRAATARAACAAGLHPALGLHHGSRVNSFALADDLMEPFRPMVDRTVRSLSARGDIAVDPETKSALAGVLQAELMAAQGATPLVQALDRLAQSLAAALRGEVRQLEIAAPPAGGALL